MTTCGAGGSRESEVEVNYYVVGMTRKNVTLFGETWIKKIFVLCEWDVRKERDFFFRIFNVMFWTVDILLRFQYCSVQFVENNFVLLKTRKHHITTMSTYCSHGINVFEFMNCPTDNSNSVYCVRIKKKCYQTGLKFSKITIVWLPSPPRTRVRRRINVYFRLTNAGFFPRIILSYRNNTIVMWDVMFKIRYWR